MLVKEKAVFVRRSFKTFFHVIFLVSIDTLIYICIYNIIIIIINITNIILTVSLSGKLVKNEVTSNE